MPTQAQIDALEALAYSGVRTITYSDGRSVSYQSLEEMLKAIAELKASIVNESGRRTTFASFKSG
jgi:DNA invertase Pin-like site-specific DNA recombinase